MALIYREFYIFSKTESFLESMLVARKWIRERQQLLVSPTTSHVRKKKKTHQWKEREA